MKKKFVLVLLIIFFSITFIILYSSLHKVEIYIPEKITNKSIIKFSAKDLFSSNEIDLSCLLVRLPELEFDHLKLRQCRQKMIQQRNILLKMVRQQHYWQTRSLAKEVREQWWKNTQTNQHKEI